MMNKPPKEITVCHLDVVVMPNGEVICTGRSIGWVNSLGVHLTPLAPPDERAPQLAHAHTFEYCPEDLPAAAYYFCAACGLHVDYRNPKMLTTRCNRQ